MLNTKQIIVTIAVFFAIANVSFAKQTEEIKVATIKSSAFTFEQKLDIENEIWEMDGIKEASYDTKSKILTVKFDDNKVTTDMMIYSIVNNLGLSAELIKTETDTNKAQKDKANKGVDIDDSTKNNMINQFENELRSIRDAYMQILFSLK